MSALVVLVIASYDYALETLYLANGEGMINGEFAFVAFQLNQLRALSVKRQKFRWFLQTLVYTRLVRIC